MKNKIKIIKEWMSETIMDSTKLKKIHTAIENNDLIVYASIQFKLNNETNQSYTAMIHEETRIVFE